MSERLVFLDVDGVFNSMASVLAYGTPTMFDDIALRLVARLCVEADAKVVLSSAWRIGRDMPECRGIFVDRGAGEISDRMIGKTACGMGVRGEEIAAYLREHGPCEYIIIDDDSDMLPEQMPRFVHTTFIGGFRVPEYVAAMRLLAPTHPDCRVLDGYKPQPHLHWDAAPPSDIQSREGR